MNIRPFKQHQPEIDASAYIDESAVVIGQVSIGADSSVWPNTTIRGDVNWIKIGNNTSIQDGSVLHVTHENPAQPGSGFPLTVGSQVTVGHNVVLHGCTIEDNCLLKESQNHPDNLNIQSLRLKQLEKKPACPKLGLQH